MNKVYVFPIEVLNSASRDYGSVWDHTVALVKSEIGKLDALAKLFYACTLEIFRPNGTSIGESDRVSSDLENDVTIVPFNKYNPKEYGYL